MISLKPFQLSGFEDLELSTQALISEALKRNVRVEVLDRSSHIIRLKKNDHVEYVKQATMTSKDSLISYFLMENKVVTKRILAENGIRVPYGKLYTSPAAAIQDYKIFSAQISVVKPVHTNFGIGVHIIPQKSENLFHHAVTDAFQHDHMILVEEFISGTEYRFLVIGNRVHAILHRVPANVTGDGKHTIRELVAIKNNNPLRGEEYKCPLQFLQLGETEAQVLAEQELHFDSVIEKDHRIFLRKNSNISTGGDSVDMTDTIHESYKHIAVQAVQAIGVAICGLDMMIQNIRVPADSQTVIKKNLPESSPSTQSGNYAIIELNFNPALHIHTYPSEGKSRDVAGPVLDILGFY
ncbi:bifunctional glutamate--cysteine ligase GshA/glutathione synthetase GshB [Candidatus Peregrinibacteria bacterium]|nr:bifunctional glutamate--cysteine ligase GshA/glutathione synthetase GshB [Candidatus Peregrinibacteria bacterium]